MTFYLKKQQQKGKYLQTVNSMTCPHLYWENFEINHIYIIKRNCFLKKTKKAVDLKKKKKLSAKCLNA